MSWIIIYLIITFALFWLGEYRSCVVLRDCVSFSITDRIETLACTERILGLFEFGSRQDRSAWFYFIVCNQGFSRSFLMLHYNSQWTNDGGDGDYISDLTTTRFNYRSDSFRSDSLCCDGLNLTMTQRFIPERFRSTLNRHAWLEEALL